MDFLHYIFLNDGAARPMVCGWRDMIDLLPFIQEKKIGEEHKSKMVDDQPITFSAEVLRKLKKRHEKSVHEALNAKQKKQLEDQSTSFLQRITTGNELLSVVIGSYAFNVMMSAMIAKRKNQMKDRKASKSALFTLWFGILHQLSFSRKPT